MKKARLTAALIFTAVLVLTSSVRAAVPEPVYVDGAAFVPLRATAEAHGAQVQWDDGSRAVHITDAQGNTHTVFVEAVGGFIQDGRAWVPLDYALEIFSAAPSQGGNITGAIHRIEYGGNTAYLFGSLHAERSGWFPLADVVEDAMRRADIFAFEIDLLDAEAIQDAMETFIFMPDGLSVEDILTPEEYEAYIYASSTHGMTEDEVRYISPMFAYLQIDLMFQMPDDMEMGDGQSVDSYVLLSALESGRPIIGLEPAAQQVEILYRPPLDILAYVATQVLPLPEMAELRMSASEDEVSIERLARYYETNDFDALAVLIIEADDGDDPLTLYYREMLFNFRSTYYANEIHRLLRETEEPTTFFITVGVSHIIRSWESDELTDIVEQLALMGIHAEPIW